MLAETPSDDCEKGRGKAWSEGVGWLSIAYTPEDGKRSSASVAYVHPSASSLYPPLRLSSSPGRNNSRTDLDFISVMGKRKNLHFFLETWVYGLLLSPNGRTITGVQTRSKHGFETVLTATHEVLLCAGAVDSPRLLLLSGIGPKKDLEALGIPCLVPLPGVGENLVDHPESIIMCKFSLLCVGEATLTSRAGETDELPPQTVMQSDTALFIRRDTSDPRPGAYLSSLSPLSLT